MRMPFLRTSVAVPSQFLLYEVRTGLINAHLVQVGIKCSGAVGYQW